MLFRKILGYILTPIVGLVFFLILCIFHPLQWLALKLFGYFGHKRVVDALNFSLIANMLLAGDIVTFKNEQKLPQGRPMIFMSNHQSDFDISPLIWFLRKYHAKFISKIELATRGIPSISFNLKYGGAANIDRKDQRQSIIEIGKLGTNMKEKGWSAMIFPEGTRSKDGKVKAFMPAGVAALLKKCPNALLVPIAIQNSWKIVRFGYYPLNTFVHVKFEVLEPIEPNKRPVDELVKEAEERIRAVVNG